MFHKHKQATTLAAAKSCRASALLVSTALGVLLSSPVLADTTVSDDSETPLATSSAGDITIAEDATLEVAGADPIIIDSDNSVTIEDDAFVYADDADGRSGILIEAGTNGSIDNLGSIYVIEDYVPDEEDGNSATAEASNRYGIRVLSASASILNDEGGLIYVEGLDSYGVSLVDGFAGDLDNEGAINVLGDNSIGISAQSVNGDLTIDGGGSVTVVGTGAQALVVSGDVSGSIVIDNTLSKSRTYTDDDGNSVSLSRSSLRVVAPTVEISGNVHGGIRIDAPPLDLDDNDDDEDDDGIDDDDELTGVIQSTGESPALFIGGPQDIVIGGVEGRDGTFSLAVDGTITATSYYSQMNATGVEIGGDVGTVNLPYGIGVSGSIQATTNDLQAIALLINENATVPLISNSGSIIGSISSSGEGATYAVQDLSGTLTAIENSGYITAAGGGGDTTVALDLRSNTTGITITQYLNDVDADAKADEEDDDDYDPSDPTVYTSINGDIMTGSGDDLLDVSSGHINGDAYLAGGNDAVRLSDDSRYIGDIHSGGGDFVMTLADTARFSGVLDVASEIANVTIADDARFSGDVENGDQLTISVNGGVLEAAEGETVAFDRLEVGADGAIGIVIDSDEGTSSNFSVNTASFAEGAAVTTEVTSLSETGGSYTVLTADSIEGGSDVDLEIDDLPLFYSASLENDGTTITLDLHRNTAEEMGLSGPQSAAYDAILATAVEDGYIDKSLLQADDIAAVQAQMDGLLPDYAGGVFDFVTRGSRLAARHISDDSALFTEWNTGAWIDGLMFNGSKDYTDTLDFKTSGMGLAGGLERGVPFGYVGVSLAWTKGSVKSGSEDDPQDIDASILELAAHWRNRAGPLYAFARVSAIRASLAATRTYTGTLDDDEFSYSSTGDWSGTGVSAMVGASYNLDLSENFTLRPKGVVDAYWLKEQGYEEEGDSDAIELTVEGRTSKAVSATGSLVASYRFGRRRADMTPLTFELEGGRRQALAGSLGKTTANFVDGDSFTLTPDSLQSGWTAEARLLAGGWYHTWQLAVGAERTQGDIDLSARATISVAF